MHFMAASFHFDFYTLSLESLEPLIGPVDVLSTELDRTIDSYSGENRAGSDHISCQKYHALGESIKRTVRGPEARPSHRRLGTWPCP